MKTIKAHWKTILFIAFALVCVVTLIYGLTTHDEAGFMADAPTWPKDHVPLLVCVESYPEGHPTGFAVTAVERAVATTNERLGFDMLVMGANDCDIAATLGVPAEEGWRDPGGDARFGAGPTCEIRTRNTSNVETLWLVLQHELGHCLGLDHDVFESSIMRPSQNPTPDLEFPPRISDSDRSLLRERYAP